MANTEAELRNRVDALENILRDRDRQEAATKVEAAAKALASDQATTAETRLAAGVAEIERIRRGAFTSFLIGQAVDKSAPLDFVALNASIPKEGWPPGTSPDQYLFTAPNPKEARIDIALTTFGRLLNNKRRIT
jgi:hypothetical protein